MSSRPNLIYIFADQLRYQSMGYNGDELATTPNIDDFAYESTIMENATSAHPVCAPYRASLLTGKYTTSTGMVINEIRINPNHKTFPMILNENGYNCEYVGKWHMYAAQLGHHFDTKNSFIPPGENRLGFNGYFASYNFHHKYFKPYAYYHLDTPEKIYCDKYEPDYQVDLAVERLKKLKNDEKPFSLFLSIGTPHDPWTKENVPKKYYEKYQDTVFPLAPNYEKKNDKHADFWAKFMPFERKKLNDWKRSYYAMVANLDDNIKRLLDEIKKLGLYDNSIIVFTSDHGEMFGAHGRRAKNIFYDEACRVPFIIHWGDKLPKTKNTTCFNTVDIMPTLLKMMNLPCPREVEGDDFSESILSGQHAENACLLMGTGPTAIWGDGYEWRGIRSEKFTYAIYRKDKSEYLFDNLSDPYQTKNLVNDENYSDVLGELKFKMKNKMKEIGDDFDKNSYYRKNWVKNREILENLKRSSEQ